MILESQLQFSDAQALTATAVSTNVVDLGVDQDIGIGKAMAVVVTVGVAADFTTGDETYKVTVQTDDNDSFSSATTVLDSAVINGDELTAGKKIVLPIGFANERYLRLNYTLAGTTPTITVDAYLQPLTEIDGYVDYADGYTIT